MKRVISVLFLLLLCLPIFSQNGTKTEQKSDAVRIYFNHNSYAINLSLKENTESLKSLSDLIEKLNKDTLTTLNKIEINSNASPDGDKIYNQNLTKKRSNTIYNYLVSKLQVSSNLIVNNYSGANWSELEKLVEESDMMYKDEVLYILKNVPEETWRRINPNDRWLSLVDSRNKHLMDLKYGNPYRYMYENLFPKLRNGSIVTIYYSKKIVEPKKEEKVVEEREVEPVVEEPVVEEEPNKTVIKPLFALKTNLLYDAASALNVELEVPIGKRWSVAGEWIFPWWTSCGNKSNSWQSGKSSKRNTFELLNANIEGKYWFGDRTILPVMTGWHLGIYTGGGKYDIEHNAKGYQGEFFIAAGLSGGYAHTINKSGNLRMEYSVGVGYLKTKYRYYKEHWGIDDTWHTIRENSGTYSWIGPTRARVSLVWMLNHKVNGDK